MTHPGDQETREAIIRQYMADLGRRCKGRPKRITDAERERRRQWMTSVNKKRYGK